MNGREAVDQILDHARKRMEVAREQLHEIRRQSINGAYDVRAFNRTMRKYRSAQALLSRALRARADFDPPISEALMAVRLVALRERVRDGIVTEGKD